MIRKFKKRDTERVMQIWLKANTEAHNFVPEGYWLSQYQSVQEQILHADIYVYEQNNEIQGFVGMTDNYLAGIFVDKKSRSAGIGTALLDCVKQNYSDISLSVYQKNVRAVSFYKREQFIIQSEGIDESTNEKEFIMAWTRDR